MEIWKAVNSNCLWYLNYNYKNYNIAVINSDGYKCLSYYIIFQGRNSRFTERRPAYHAI